VELQESGRMLRPKAYCAKYSISRTTLWRWLRDGKLEHAKVGKQILLVPDRLPESEAA
jgi:excisionase family DNA binding protein